MKKIITIISFLIFTNVFSQEYAQLIYMTIQSNIDAFTGLLKYTSSEEDIVLGRLKSRKKKSDPKGWMIYDISVPHFMKEMEKKGWSVISTDMAGIGTTMIPNVLVHIYFRKD